MMVDMLRLIFMISTMMMNLLVIMNLLGLRHVVFTLDLLGETLSLNDVILDDDITQTGGSCVIDEVDPSAHCPRRYKYSQMYYYIVLFF